MATINSRGPYQYQAIVRRKGYPTQTKTFEKKQDAKDWASTVESTMRHAIFVDRTEAEMTTLGELLERYKREVTPGKRGKGPEMSRMKRLIAHPLAMRRLTQLRPADFTSYGNERRKQGASEKAIREELVLYSAVFTIATEKWSIPIVHPLAKFELPRGSKWRERRPSHDEEARLLAACRESKSAGLECAVVLAIETGMRRGEIAGLSWSHVDLCNHVIRLSLTKNGDKRIVPLSEKAEDALRGLLLRNTTGKVFTFHDSNGIGAAFARACARAGIEDLHFHDLRHEAASRLAPRMTAPLLAKLMGWRTLQTVMRYYNPREQELVALVRAA